MRVLCPLAWNFCTVLYVDEMQYRPDLDGLRCIAVLLVLIFHFELFPLGEAGFIGVDMFFVLSGFLISSISWQQLNDGRFNLGRFYAKRIRRLAPALVIAQLLVLGFAYLRLLPVQTLPISWQSIATQAYAINFYLWRNVDYFGVHAETVPLLHCWSLAIEEQFYLFFPLGLLLIHRYARKFLWQILLAAAMLSFGLNLWFVKSHPLAVFYLLPTRAWELLVGAILATGIAQLSSSSVRRHGAAILGLACIAVTLAVYDKTVPFPGLLALLPCLGTGLLILAGSGAGSFLSPLLQARPVVYIGRISYSLYLVHWPLRVLGAEQFAEYDITARWSLFLASFVLSAAVYHVVEDPVRRGRFLPRTRPMLGAYVASAAGIIAVSASSVLTEGWRFRFSEAALARMDFAESWDVPRLRCEFKSERASTLDQLCRLGQKDVAPTWFIVGDSHALALAEAIHLALGREHQAGYLLFGHGCLPVADLGAPHCRHFNKTALEYARDMEGVKSILLVSIWRQALTSLEGADGRLVKGEALTQALSTQLGATIEAYRKEGKQVYVWAPLPAARRSVPILMAEAVAFGRSDDSHESRAAYEQVFAPVYRAFDENQRLLAGVVSPIPLLCTETVCDFQHDGTPLFSDNNHPAFSASQHFSAVFTQQMLAGR